MLRRFSILLSAAMALGLGTYTFAQDANGGGNNNPPPPNGQDQNGRGNRGGFNRGNFDPAQMRQRMLDMAKERLGASDDEWKVISPRLEKVMQLQRDTRGGGMGFMFGGGRDRGGDRGGQQSAEQSAVQKAAADLRSALDDKSVSADEIAKRLATYRQAKEQAKAELTKAQADLKELLSQRQEAMLVMYGMLD